MGVDVRVTLSNRYGEDESYFESQFAEFDLGNIHAFRPHLPGFDPKYPCGVAVMSFPAVKLLLAEGSSSYYKSVSDFIESTLQGNTDAVIKIHWS